jgi:nicotinamidase-related amidase
MDRHTRPDFARIALLTVDLQKDTLDGAPFEVPGTSAILPAARRLAEAFRGAGRPVVHVVRLYGAQAEDADLCRRGAIEGGARFLQAGSRGAGLADGLLPHAGAQLDPSVLLSGGIQPLGRSEVAIYKPRWGAFFRTPLDGHLRGAGVNTLAFIGCNFPNCPRSSIYEASERDYRIIVVTDAVSGLYERAARELENIGCALMTAKELERAISQRTEADAHG